MKKTLLILAAAAVCTMSACTATTNDAGVTQQPSTGSDTQQATQQATQQVSQTQTAAAQANFIGEEKAEQIALEKAGLTANDVTFVNIDLDRDDGVWKYEVEFRQGRTEYDAEINAVDGTILKWEMDKD